MLWADSGSDTLEEAPQTQVGNSQWPGSLQPALFVLRVKPRSPFRQWGQAACQEHFPDVGTHIFPPGRGRTHTVPLTWWAHRGFL